MRTNRPPRPLAQTTQSVEELKKSFSAPNVPVQQNYDDLIALATTAYTLVGGDGTKPAPGLKLNENGALSLQLSEAAGEGGLTIDINDGLGVNMDTGSGLWLKEGQLGVDPAQLLSVNAFEELDPQELQQISTLLATANPFGEQFGHEQSWAAETVSGSHHYHCTVAAISADGCTLAYRVRNDSGKVVVRVRRRAHASMRWPETAVDINVGNFPDEKDENESEEEYKLRHPDRYGFYLAVSESGRLIAFSSGNARFCCVYRIDDQLKATLVGKMEENKDVSIVIDVSESEPCNQLVALDFFSNKPDYCNVFEPRPDSLSWERTVHIPMHGEEEYRHIDNGALCSDKTVMSLWRDDTVCVYSVPEKTWIEPHIAIQDHGNSYGNNRVALSKDGSQVIVGTRTEDGVSQASIYMLKDNEWKVHDTLNGPSWEKDARRQVAVCTNDRGDIAIGQTSHEAHEVYVYYRSATGWSPAHHLTAEQVKPTGRYGARLKMSADGSTLLVMAWDRVYVYSRAIDHVKC